MAVDAQPPQQNVGKGGPPPSSDTFAVSAGLAATFSSVPSTLGLVSSAVIVAGLQYGRDIRVPLALAFFLGFILDPLVVRLKRLGISRPLAVTVVVCMTLAAILAPQRITLSRSPAPSVARQTDANTA